jgi:hypothetical protein
MKIDFIRMLLECQEILPTNKHKLIARIKELKADAPKLLQTQNKLDLANK